MYYAPLLFHVRDDSFVIFKPEIRTPTKKELRNLRTVQRVLGRGIGSNLFALVKYYFYAAFGIGNGLTSKHHHSGNHFRVQAPIFPDGYSTQDVLMGLGEVCHSR